MKRPAALAAVAVVFAGALCIHLGRPFLRHREAVGSQYAVMAWNHVRLGLSQTRLASYEVTAPDPALYENWREYCYPNRPFLSVLVTSAWFRLFGPGEEVLRLSLLAVALGALFAFYKLVERLLDARWTIPATAMLAFNPMFWYFSVVAVHLVYALAFSLAAWACWVRWADGRRFRILTVAFLFLACQSDWPGYYATLSIALDAFLGKKRALGAALFSIGIGAFLLHVLHLWSIDPMLVRRLFSAGVARSAQGLAGPLTFVGGELRELGIYFTVGLLGLGLGGLRSLPRRGWLLALLGLDEILFMRWAHVHDYLTYPLAPFFALLAAMGAQTLWTTPARKAATAALLALAAVQSIWITGNRLTREGAYEVNHRAALAVREGTRESDKVLITIADERQFTSYYSGRLTAGVEPGEPELMIHPSGRRYPMDGGFERYFGDYSVVLVGDRERAASEIMFFKGHRPPPEFRFLDSEDPLRKKLDALALSKEIRGAFVLYRLR